MGTPCDATRRWPNYRETKLWENWVSYRKTRQCGEEPMKSSRDGGLNGVQVDPLGTRWVWSHAAVSFKKYAS